MNTAALLFASLWVPFVCGGYVHCFLVISLDVPVLKAGDGQLILRGLRCQFERSDTARMKGQAIEQVDNYIFPCPPNINRGLQQSSALTRSPPDP
ncbi:hypothetical protein SAMN05216316_0285 [Nitrosovibrio sp. Nv6]|nr:hypothetical protein SAMN05216316_0285 [Nitrosovibrio sp. Nv6]